MYGYINIAFLASWVNKRCHFVLPIQIKAVGNNPFQRAFVKHLKWPRAHLSARGSNGIPLLLYRIGNEINQKGLLSGLATLREKINYYCLMTFNWTIAVCIS